MECTLRWTQDRLGLTCPILRQRLGGLLSKRSYDKRGSSDFILIAVSSNVGITDSAS